MRLATWRGRRSLVGRFRRLTRWEFWPPYIFYQPVICYIAWLALKQRSLTLFTAANPAIVGGGFVGESKIEILRGLAPAGDFVARATLIEASLEVEARVAQAKGFMAERGFGFPLVLKPDQGQRGSGVAVAAGAGVCNATSRASRWRCDSDTCSRIVRMTACASAHCRSRPSRAPTTSGAWVPSA